MECGDFADDGLTMFANYKSEVLYLKGQSADAVEINEGEVQKLPLLAAEPSASYAYRDSLTTIFGVFFHVNPLDRRTIPSDNCF